MPYEGYADPVANDGSRLHSNVPISELTEHVTPAIEASNVSSAPPVVRNHERVTHKTQPTPTKPNGAQGPGTPNTSARP